MGILDDNLDQLDTEITNSPRHQKKSALHHSHTSPKSKSSTTHHSKSSSPKSTRKEEKSGTTSRLRALNPFRQKNKNESLRDQFKRTKSGRRISQRRKEQKEAMESAKQSKEKKNDVQEILDEVLRKYPKERCKTFADHKEFAFAELTVVSNEKRDFHLDAKKFNDLKSMLQTRLADALGEDDSVADSAKIDESSHQHSQRQRQSQTSSPQRIKRLASPPGSPAKIASPSTRHYNSASPQKRSTRTSPKQFAVHNQSQQESPQRSRTVVPSPPLTYSPQKSSPKMSGVLLVKNCQSLLPPRVPGEKFGPRLLGE